MTLAIASTGERTGRLHCDHCETNASSPPVQNDVSQRPPFDPAPRPTLYVSLANAALPLALALDLGTSSVRAVLYDRLGYAVEGFASQVRYDVTTTPDGGVEADPVFLRALAEACIDEILGALPEPTPPIASVGLSCFWHSLLGIDAARQPTTPVLYWADNRSAHDAERLRHDLDEAAIRQRTGCVLHSSYWPAKLSWLARSDPALIERTDLWISAGDFLTLSWMDEVSTSVCMASATGLFNIHTSRWDDELAIEIGLPLAKLPLVVDRDQSFSLSPSNRHRWPALANAAWFPALGDGACANLGCGALDSNRVALTLGTTGAIRILKRHPTGGQVPVYDGLFAYRLDRDTMVYGAAISNGGILLDWIRQLLGDASGTELRRAGELPPDSHGLTILPFVAGERAPIWNDKARAVIAGLDLATRPADVIRAAMESVALRMALLHHLITPIAEPGHRVMANGAALLRSSTWMTIMADTLATQVAALPVNLEASARGAALSALQSSCEIDRIAAATDPAGAAIIVESNPSASRIYQAAGRRQRLLQDRLYPARDDWDDPTHPQ